MTQTHNQLVLPWLQLLWSRLWACARLGNFPHALLFSGPSGVGKLHLAQVLMQALCCEQVTESGESCGDCHGCRMVKAGSHPDCLVIAPEAPSQVIRVDVIREIGDFATHSALIGKYKIIIIDNAPSMNSHAANALLKVLEEPPAGTIFILLSPLGGFLPATVTSRCQRILFPVPEEALALSWLSAQHPNSDVATLLRLSEGAPLKASAWLQTGLYALQTDFYNDWKKVRQLPENLIDISTKWSSKPIQEKVSTKLLLDWLFFWLREELYQQVARGHLHSKWLDFCTHLQQTYAAVTAVPQLNRQLIVEDVMLAGINACN